MTKPSSQGGTEGIERGSHDLADRLRESKDRILNDWAERTRDLIPAANSLDKRSLIDSLPLFLEELAHALASPEPRGRLRKREHELAREHGAERGQVNHYGLSQVIDEYHLLREVLFKHLRETGPLTERQTDIILDAIQIGVRNATSEFMVQRKTRDENADRELRASEERYRLVVEGVVDHAIIVTDAGGNVVHWNTGAEKILQYSRDEVLGRSTKIIFTPEDLAHDVDVEERTKSTKDGKAEDKRWHVRRDGTRFFANGIMNPLRDEDGRVYGFVKVLRDDTERQRLEGVAESARRVLEESETRLKALATNLEEERSLREKFVNMLTHDLRTPLAACKMSAQVLNRRIDDRDLALNMSERLIANVDRMDQMVQSLLDANRIKAGQPLSIQVAECDLATVVHEALDTLTLVHGDRFVLNVRDVAPGRWDCEGLRRVTENLAINAIKYGDAEAKVTIDLRREADVTVLSVHNLGTELTAPDQRQLFEEFSRTSSARRSGLTGWGIGLTLVKGIAEAHGGTASVESDGRGTTFIVRLPNDSTPFLAKS